MAVNGLRVQPEDKGSLPAINPRQRWLLSIIFQALINIKV